MSSTKEEAVFDKRPISREERAYSVSSSGHVHVNVRELFASPEARNKLVKLAKRVGASSE